jgi:hypothetical protein
MAASISVYNTFAHNIARAVDLSSATVRASLHTSSYSPSQTTNEVYADATNELSTANGYTNGGQSLTSVTWNRSGAVATLDAADVVWTASGGSITARYAVLRLLGTFNSLVDPLIAYILLDTTPADVTVTNLNTLTLQWNASGIVTVTRS